MNVARMNYKSATPLEGKVAVVGGSSGSADLPSIEVFDPTAGKGTIGIQVPDKSGYLWFSNNWTGLQTANSPSAAVIQVENLQAH